MVDCVILSISSAIGQLFIFYTIAHFGPVVFIIIMTVRQVRLCIVRICFDHFSHNNFLCGFFFFFPFFCMFLQAFAILLSCIVYQHYISAIGIIGIIIVFISLFLRVYCAQRLKMLRRKIETNKSLLSTNSRTANV